MRFIDSQHDFDGVVDTVAGSSLLAIDTEAAGYHRYRDRVCVVQLSTRQSTWVVDGLAVDVAPLGRVLLDEATEVVLHDAEYDLRLLGRDYGVGVNRLFDTKVAAQFIGESSIGLAGLAQRHLGVRLDKTHQRADWAKRPLSEEQLEYAAEDTRHLPALRDRLAESLESLGRMEWAREEFGLRAATTASAEPDIEPFWKLRNIRDLRGRQLAALRAVWSWRDETARRRDVAPFRVLGNDAVVNIARACPASRAQLADVPAMPGSLMDRYGSDILGVVIAALATPPESWPVRKRGPRRPPPDPDFDRRADRLRAVRDQVAAELHLERGFLMPRQQLEDIARRCPADIEALRAMPDVRNWQVEALGKRIIAALR
ncbi:MAG: HRDC domain-containing protein [Gemmatimonadota bacterium]|jgi:ribonuclease D